MSEANIIYGGGGSNFPAIMMWSNPLNGKDPIVFSEFSKGASVYAISVSPGGIRIAAGTKSGLLKTFPLTDYHASKGITPLFEIYHPPAVLSIAFSTDDIFASGGIDGKIKFWSISKQKKLCEILAHRKGVLALCRLGSLAMASIGGDGKLRVWDLDSLENKFEDDTFILPQIQALTSLTYNMTIHLLIHPSRTGDLHIYDIPSNFKKTIIKAHDGDFCAVACGNLCGHENIVTGGYEDKMLKIWSSKADKLICEATSDKEIISVGWCGKDQIMVVTADGTGQIWSFNGTLTPGQKFKNYDLRTTSGLSSFLVTKSFVKRRKELLNTLIFEADGLLRAHKANEYPEAVSKRLREITQELYDNDFQIESTSLYADILRRNNKHSEELKVRLYLAKTIKGKLESVPNLYALGDLLERWNEPELAKKYFQEIMDINPDYRNAPERFANIKSHPLSSLNPANTIRADFNNQELITSELEKCTLLNKKFNWKSMLYMMKPLKVGRQVDMNDIVDSLSEIMNKTHSTQPKIKQIYLSEKNQIKEFKMMCLSTDIKGIIYAFRLESTTWDSKFLPFVIFDPSCLDLHDSLDPKEYNQQLKDVWINNMNSKKTRTKLEEINILAISSIRKAIAKMKAEF